MRIDYRNVSDVHVKRHGIIFPQDALKKSRSLSRESDESMRAVESDF